MVNTKMRVALFLRILNLNFLNEMVRIFDINSMETTAIHTVAIRTITVLSILVGRLNLLPTKVITIGISIIPAPAGEGTPTKKLLADSLLSDDWSIILNLASLNKQHAVKSVQATQVQPKKYESKSVPVVSLSQK